MAYTVKQLAQLAGVSERTLRYYDQIGLLQPTRTPFSGYRCYNQKEVDRLQQILFYRELGLPLSAIKKLLDTPNFNAVHALKGHLRELRAKRKQLDQLIGNAEHSIAALKGEENMQDSEKFTGFKRQMVEKNEQTYGEEVRRLYGDETMDASQARLLNMSEANYTKMQQVNEELNQLLKRAVKQGGPASELGRQVAAKHREWLAFHWAKYTPEAHKGLADMYVGDERFTAYYEEIAPGAAQFLHDAIYSYCDG